jgi:hypothetical protein
MGSPIIKAWPFVADTANFDLLGFDVQALATGGGASCLASQNDFTHHGDNRWSPPVGDTPCWPCGAAASDDML